MVGQLRDLFGRMRSGYFHMVVEAIAPFNLGGRAMSLRIWYLSHRPEQALCWYSGQYSQILPGFRWEALVFARFVSGVGWHLPPQSPRGNSSLASLSHRSSVESSLALLGLLERDYSPDFPL